MLTCPKSQNLSTLSNGTIYVGAPTSSTAPQCTMLRGEPGSRVNPFPTFYEAVSCINKIKNSSTITICCTGNPSGGESTTVIVIPNNVTAITNPTGNSVIPPIQISGSQNLNIHGITTPSITINGSQKDVQNIQISNSNILSKISASSRLKSKVNLVISDCVLGSNEKNTGALLTLNSKDDSELHSEIRNSTANAEHQLGGNLSAIGNSIMTRKYTNNNIVSKGVKENVDGNATMSTANDGNSYRTGASIPSIWQNRTVTGSGKFIKNHVNGTYIIKVLDAFTSNNVSSNGSVKVTAKNIISTISHEKTTTEEGNYLTANMTNQAKTSYNIDGHQLNLDGLSWNNISQKNASEFAVKFHNHDINIHNLNSSNVHNVVSTGTSNYDGEFLNSKLNVNTSTASSSSSSSTSKTTSLFNYQQNDSSQMNLSRQNVTINYNGQIQGHTNNSTDSSEMSVADTGVHWNSQSPYASPVSVNLSGNAKQKYYNTSGAKNTPNSLAYEANCSGNSQLQTQSQSSSFQSSGSSINVTDNAVYYRLQNNCNFQGTGFTHQENVQGSGNFNLQSNSNNYRVGAAPSSSLFKSQHSGTSTTHYEINGDSYEMDLSNTNAVGMQEEASGQATANSSTSNVSTIATIDSSSQLHTIDYKGSTNVTNERSNNKKNIKESPRQNPSSTKVLPIQSVNISENTNTTFSSTGSSTLSNSSRTVNTMSLSDNANYSRISRNGTITSLGSVSYSSVNDNAKYNYVSNGALITRVPNPDSLSNTSATPTYELTHNSSQPCTTTDSSSISDHGGNPGNQISSTGTGQCHATTTNNEESNSSSNSYSGISHRQANSSQTGGINTYSRCTVNQSGCAIIDAPIKISSGTTLSTNSSTLVSNTNQPIVSALSNSNINIQTSSIQHKPSKNKSSEASRITLTASVTLDDSSTADISASNIESNAGTIIYSVPTRGEQASQVSLGTTAFTGAYGTVTNTNVTTSESNRIDGNSTIEGDITTKPNTITSSN